jgi:aminoglycoside 6'-N-acetyltransferase
VDRQTNEWSFRPLTFEDLVQFQDWVHQPHVYEWWYEDALSLDQLVEIYGPDIEGRGTTHCYIVDRDGRPFGYVQWYRLRDEPEWMPPFIRFDEADVAIDLFIGDEAGVGRGLGPEMIRAFLRDIVFEASDAPFCWIDPDPPNGRAVRAYAKAGFRPVALVDRVVEGKLDRALIMRLARDDLD